MLNFSRLKMETIPMATSAAESAPGATAKGYATATATKRSNGKLQLHATHNPRHRQHDHHRRSGSSQCLTACTNCGGMLLQVFLILTLFVIGNLSAWQENIRPKLYVELGKSTNKSIESKIA